MSRKHYKHLIESNYGNIQERIKKFNKKTKARKASKK